jgi:hypothetical protein
MRVYLQNQLRRIDDNVAELRRLTVEQNEVIILCRCQGRDIAEEEATYRRLHVSLRDMERDRLTTAKLLVQAEAYYDALPSGMI